MTDLTPTSYNRYSRYLHWLMAFLILLMVFLGWRFDDKDTFLLNRANLHKSIGILILLLTVLRIGLRLAYKAPSEPPMPKWQVWAAQALHVGFYVVMIAMPLSGWLMVSTSARDIPFFGIPWPHFPFVPVEAQEHGPIHETFENVHGLIAKLLFYGMIPLHVLAALKHQFVDKDTVVEHMVPGLKPRPILNYRWLLPIGVVGLAVAVGFGIYRGTPLNEDKPAPPVSEGIVADSASTETSASSEAASESVSSSSEPAAITTWTVDKPATTIAFATTFSGEAINGGFNNYTANIAFDPEQLDASRVKVTIDLSSVNSGDGDRDGTLKSDAFFNVAATPKAIYEASSFSKTDATHFIAKGRLTMHGMTKPLTLPFTLNIKSGVAVMSGTVDLDRTVFGVGTGDWAKTDAVPAKVTVKINLKAKASK